MPTTYQHVSRVPGRVSGTLGPTYISFWMLFSEIDGPNAGASANVEDPPHGRSRRAGRSCCETIVERQHVEVVNQIYICRNGHISPESQGRGLCFAHG